MSNLENLACCLPAPTVPADIDAEEVLAGWASAFESLSLRSFTPDALWRDILGLSGTFQTTYGSESILTAWNKLSSQAKPSKFEYIKGSGRVIQLGTTSWIEGEFQFATNGAPRRTCVAGLSLVVGDDGKWRIWVLRTFVDQLFNHSNVDHMSPCKKEANDLHETLNEKASFECVVVGAGQAGLSVAGRLQALGVDYVVLEKNKLVGDSWKDRYNSTKRKLFWDIISKGATNNSSQCIQHENRVAHLPFNRTFPDSYPRYLSKDDLARGYSDWAVKYGIRVLLRTTLLSGKWDPKHSVWHLNLSSEGLKGISRQDILSWQLGVGVKFQQCHRILEWVHLGGTIYHSVDYKSPDEWKGKHGVVIGTANTAHDVAEDMLAAGLASVTMIQRSPTYVLPAEYYSNVQDLTYNAQIPTELADQMALTPPIAVTRLVSMLVLNGMAQSEPERFDNLEKAGFKVLRNGDIVYQVFDRFGGHYMDVGASEKISKGLIKIKSDVLPIQYTKNGLLLSDKSELLADLVVFATGFVGSMKNVIGQLFGPEVESRVEDFWGVDVHGEIRGAYKPSGHPNLWMHGGTCIHARYMSRFLALQIRAALDGTPFLKEASNDEGLFE